MRLLTLGVIDHRRGGYRAWRTRLVIALRVATTHRRVVPGDDVGDERLETVAACHADDVCAAGERGFGQRR
jgi:hypothetical protein